MTEKDEEDEKCPNCETELIFEQFHHYTEYGLSLDCVDGGMYCRCPYVLSCPECGFVGGVSEHE